MILLDSDQINALARRSRRRDSGPEELYRVVRSNLRAAAAFAAGGRSMNRYDPSVRRTRLSSARHPSERGSTRSRNDSDGNRNSDVRKCSRFVG